MWNFVLKLLCWMFVLCTNFAIAYHSSAYNSKTAYIESQLKQRFSSNDYKTRYSHLQATTTYKPPWYRNHAIRHTTTTSTPKYLPTQTTYNNGLRIRHSRFPNLDNILTKLDHLHPTTKKPSQAQSWNPYDKYPNENDDNLFDDNYDEDEFNNYEDELEDEDSLGAETNDDTDYDPWETDKEQGDEATNDEENDYETDDDLFLDDEEEDTNEEDNWQAEEANAAPQPSPSSFTEYKWQHYGTRSRVEQSRKNQQYPEHSSSYAEINAAVQHAVRVHREARCRDPQPKVLSVQSEHPDPGKTYIPHCTVLHRCAEDTGCCPSHTMRCAAKKQVLVNLYFYTTTVGKPGNKVEKLAFYNHTECACLDKSIEPSTDTSSEETAIETPRHYRSSNPSFKSGSENLLVPAPQNLKRCKCPEEYSPRLTYGLSCICDCTDGNIDCSLMKKGKEFFSLKDRLCVMNDQCGSPSCEYGSYMRQIGRCPRKQETSESFSKGPRHLH